MREQINLEEVEEDNAMRRKLLEKLNATPNEDLHKLADKWRTLNFDCSFDKAIAGKRNKDKIECADELESKIKNK